MVILVVNVLVSSAVCVCVVPCSRVVAVWFVLFSVQWVFYFFVGMPVYLPHVCLIVVVFVGSFDFLCMPVCLPHCLLTPFSAALYRNIQLTLVPSNLCPKRDYSPDEVSTLLMLHCTDVCLTLHPSNVCPKRNCSAKPVECPCSAELHRNLYLALIPSNLCCGVFCYCSVQKRMSHSNSK